MKKIYTNLNASATAKGLFRISAVILFIMVWILIDKGNVYGQSQTESASSKLKKEKAQASDDMLKFNGGDDEDIIDEGTGTDEDNTLVVYPNPVEGDLVFDFEFTVKSGAPFEIVDALGKLVDQGVIKPGVSQQKVDLSKLKTGLYILRVDLGGKPIVKRLVKK